ncbi:hypothetical protein Q5P01_001916 [Channa striata]|uniref:Myb-like domain-containing protein n=1 Tax=Channa striata TaxID=64152 RepID=A0AA88T5P6_CHASR|nr:hypothetical protein Q5P01_001916 [Channa striata]
MSSRKRRPNWTDQESLLLAQLMQERKDIIRGKCSTGVSVQDKRQAWEEIAQTINTAFPHIQRTVSDCNKKWENLLAKSKEEIKRQKIQPGADAGLSLEQFSTVTQIVISVMNLADMLQRDIVDSSVLEMVETQHNSCDKDGNDHSIDEKSEYNNPLTQCKISTYLDPSTCPEEQKITVPESPAVQFSSPHAAVFTVTGKHSDTPCSTSPTSVHCTTLQERMDLELSVLRRQEAVLKLQEEYYTLKIKLMKKQMEESVQKD